MFHVVWFYNGFIMLFGFMFLLGYVGTDFLKGLDYEPSMKTNVWAKEGPRRPFFQSSLWPARK